MGKSDLEERISDSHYASNAEFERSGKIFTRRIVPDDVPLRILDVGCGTGLNAQHLAAKGHTVVGLDLSPVAISKFRQKGFEGIVCDVEKEGGAPFPSGSFDLIFASEVIEHVADTATFLAELNRLVRVGGTLVLSTPNSAFWPYRILGVLGRTATEYQHPGHVRFFSRRYLVNSLKAAGFAIEKISARHIYCICSSGIGDPIAPVLKRLGFAIEPRFATGGYFWQLSKFASDANSFWADTFIVLARKKATN
jgi:2-polyprenyl-3-methyl-5-hydroxy-6-metoxy-1,4-benzoquinol methylase